MNLIFQYSPEKDVEVYMKSVVKFQMMKMGRENMENKLLTSLPPDLQEIIKQTPDEAELRSKILDYLNTNYANETSEVTLKMRRLEEEWKKNGAAVIKSLEFLFQKKFPFEEITVYMSTVPICPYKYPEYIYVYFKESPKGQLSVIRHEFNHFMFFYYYQKAIMSQLDPEKFQILKESLTFFSNPEQSGKPDEEPIRQFYLSKDWKDLDEVIQAGVEYLKAK